MGTLPADVPGLFSLANCLLLRVISLPERAA
jgi:hypothetical protein